MANGFQGVVPDNWGDEGMAVVTYTRALNVMRKAPTILLPERSSISGFLAGFAQRITLMTHEKWIQEMALAGQNSEIEWQTHAFNWVTQHFQVASQKF